MTVKLLTEHHLEFLCLKGDCTGSSESTHVKIPHCWKSCVAAQMKYVNIKDEFSFWRFLMCQINIGNDFYGLKNPS